MFVDKTINQFIAGRGGNGCVSFRREKYVPKGGPDGGDGGDGGSVILKSAAQVKSLIDLKYRPVIRAENGKPGSGANRHGKTGLDTIIEIPAGTVIKSFPDEILLYDFSRPGQMLTIARGGRGGKGNTHFKSSTRQVPRQATPGTDGESIKVICELKLIAFAGLLGFPNAGKSTLISRLTKARPKIADYPFTTLYPHLGVLYQGHQSCVIADIPGIIPNAHRGEGMGIEFLRHVERTQLLLYLLDVSIGSPYPPLEAFKILRNELSLYQKQLDQKPFFVVLNKMDLEDKERHSSADLSRYCTRHGIQLLRISALRGLHLDRLKQKIFENLDE